MQKEPAKFMVSLEAEDAPTSPADVDGSQTAGAGKAAGEGSPGGSQAAGGSALGDGDRHVRAETHRENVAEARAKKEFAHEHCLPLKGILERSGRSSLSRGLIV